MSGEDKYRLFLNGDKDAFDRIMCEYFDGLIFFINRYVNDPHTAEELHENISAEEESPENAFLKSAHIKRRFIKTAARYARGGAFGLF